MIKFKAIMFVLAILAITFSSCRDCVEGTGVLLSENRASIISDFTEIEADGDFDVFLTMDSIYEVIVEGDDNIVPYIRTTIKGDRLVIENRSTKCFKYDQAMEVHVRAPFVDKVVLNGSGNIECYNWGFYKELLTLQNSGSGNITFEHVITDEIEARLYGSGNIKITGEGDKSYLYLYGSGNIKSIDFISDDSYANNSGSGNIYLAFLDGLTADLSGSGTIYFRGDDRLVRYNDTGSGSVREY